MAKGQKPSYIVTTGLDLTYMPQSYKGEANWDKGVDKLVGDPTVLSELKNGYVMAYITMEIPLQGKTLKEINDSVWALKANANICQAVADIKFAQEQLAKFFPKEGSTLGTIDIIALNSDNWNFKVNKNKLMYHSATRVWTSHKNSSVEPWLINVLESLSNNKGVKLKLGAYFSTMWYSNKGIAYGVKEFVEHRREQIKLLNI